MKLLAFFLLIDVAFLAIPVYAYAPAYCQTYVASYGYDNLPTYLFPLGGGTGYVNIIHAGDPRITNTTTTYQQLLGALQVAQSGDVIFIPGGTTINFTGLNRLRIPANVTVASDRGYAGSNGANLIKIDQTNSWGDDGGIFIADGRFVRITGLNFTGPDTSTSYDSSCSYYPVGIFLQYNGDEVDNNEVSGFGGGGIMTLGYDPSWTAGDVNAWHYIHNNNIHDNHCYGEGYGIAVNSNSTAYIEANTFNYNRHHVASGYNLNDTYEFAWNYVGLWQTTNYTVIAEALDVHGQQQGAGPYNGMWLGGTQQVIHHNQFDNTNWTGGGQKGMRLNGTWVIYNRINASQDAIQPTCSFNPPYCADGQPFYHFYNYGSNGIGNMYIQNNYIRGLADHPADFLYPNWTTYYGNNSLVVRMGSAAGTQSTWHESNPVMFWIPNQTVTSGQTLSLQVDGMSPVTDSTNTSSPLTFSASGLPSGATFIMASHYLYWTPNDTNAGWNGPITITATDAGGNSTSESFMIDVTPQAPLHKLPQSIYVGLLSEHLIYTSWIAVIIGMLLLRYIRRDTS